MTSISPDRRRSLTASSSDDSDGEEEVPHFMTDEMSSTDLLERMNDLLVSEFGHLGIAIYLNRYRQTDFLSSAMIMNGMISHDRLDLFQELLGIWGYYLTLQRNPDAVALSNISELISRRRYLPILDGLLSTCKSLSILSRESKQTIIKSIIDYIKAHKQNLRLRMKSLEYLFEMTRKEVLGNYKDPEFRDGMTKKYDSISIDVAAFYDEINAKD